MKLNCILPYFFVFLHLILAESYFYKFARGGSMLINRGKESSIIVLYCWQLQPLQTPVGIRFIASVIYQRMF